jgi:hypothetical protein
MKKREKYIYAWEKSNKCCIFCGKDIPWYSIHHLFRERRTDEHLVPCCWDCHTLFHNGIPKEKIGKFLASINHWFPNELFYIESNNIKVFKSINNDRIM